MSASGAMVRQGLNAAGDLRILPAAFTKRVRGRLGQGPYSELRRYGLKRDLTVPIRAPKARIPITVRPLVEQDLNVILPLQGVESDVEKREIQWRRDFYEKIPHGCFVAVDQRTGTPCYMQWLLGSEDNELLARFKCFPRLKKGEALLEQAYTLPSYRGRYVMPAAMAKIAEHATDLGARFVLTFVEENNKPSLKGCQRAGFNPYLFHRRTQMGYGTVIRNTFTELAEHDPRRTAAF